MSLRQVQIMLLSTTMEQVLFRAVLYGLLVTKEWLKPLQQVQASLISWPTSLVVLEIPSQLQIVLEML